MLHLIENFKLGETGGEIFDLYDYQKKSMLLLIIYRGEWCGSCRRQLMELNNRHGWFRKRDIKIVALSSDILLYTSILKDIIKPQFPLLADPDWRVLGRFGLRRPQKETDLKPAIFLINKQHQIIFKYIGEYYNDRPSLARIKKIISNLHT